MKKALIALAALAASACTWADYPTQDIISLNISNDSSYTMTGSGETETLAGTLPDNAWQNTANADRTGTRVSGDARNGYRNGVTAWDGTSGSITNLDNVVFSWAVEGSGTANYGSASRSPTFQGAWLARASGQQTDAALELQNIPYEKYDVIIYLSGDAANAASPAFRAVCVNGIPYVGDANAADGTTQGSSVADTWGTQQSTLELGKNALKVSGLTSDTLVLTMRNAGYLSGSTKKQGISAVQVVRDMSAIGANTRPVSTARVISVNLQSTYSSTGVKPEYYGLELVPASAWTEDGFSSASSSGANITADIKEWNGAEQQVNVLTDVTINEKAANGYNWKSNYVPMYHLVNAYLDDGGDRARITVTGVPYKKYDVIVYTATDSSEYKFGPVTVNGTPYRWSASNNTTQQADGGNSTSATRWGFSRSRVPAYGANALRITDQTESTLTIKGGNNDANARGGIAGFQIVDTYDPSAIPSVIIADGGTLEVSAAQEMDLRVVCDGSITVVGVNDYTATNADLLKFDFGGVTGTVTLGTNTCYALASSRTLPSGYLFGEGSAVAIAETAEEYAKDAFSVSGLTGVSTVVLTRYDGTTINLAVTNGEVARGDGTDVRVIGAAALYDFQFNNTVTTTPESRTQATLSSGNRNPGEYYVNGGGIMATLTPWLSLNGKMSTWSEFSVAVVGIMPSGANKVFAAFGQCDLGSHLFIGSGAKANEVVVGYGSTSSTTILTTMTVPNAATARHVYLFELSDNKEYLTIYLDGILWKKNITRSGGFPLGTSAKGGIQIGNGYGGTPSGYAAANDGVFNAMIVYDYIPSDKQIEALSRMYPYSSPSGSYSREVSGETNFATEAPSWTKVGDAELYTVPADGAAITIEATAAADVSINATLSAESLNLEGEGPLTIKKGDGLLTSAGLTTIATDVTIEGGAADISGAPTVVADGGSICFDYSEYDLFAYTGTRLIPLTGEIDEQAQGVVTCVVPTGDFTREHTSEFLYTNGCYQLLVTCREGRDVYLPVGTTRFEDGTQVKYFVEVPADPEEPGDPEIVTNECYAISADTVHFLDADTVTVARTTPVAGYAFGDYAGTLVLAPGQEELILNTTITGAGKVEVASGVVQSRGSIGIATDIDVDAGAVLKLGSVGGFGATGGGTTPSGKAITVTGTVELNGVLDSCNAFTLAGGTLRNTGTAIPTGNRQTTALTLTANSTVRAGSDFGLVASQYAATSLELGGYTLAKTGDASFWLYNTRSTGTGVVDVQAGAVYLYSDVDMPNVDFNVAEGATLKVRTDGLSIGTISGAGTVDIGQSRPDDALNFADDSSLNLKITLASTTEANVRISYTGPRPSSVTVYEPSGNWDVESTASTVSYEDGYIVISVDVADTRRDNPALDGDQATFRFTFRGTVDAAWETAGNWYDTNGSRWSPYTGSGDLGPNFTNQYESVLFDGDLMDNLVPDADGYKNVTVSTRMEGWAMKVGLFNHVKVSTVKVKKQQGGCWYMVDATSKLIMSDNSRAGNNGNKVTFYVAAKDGVEFTGDFNFSGTDGVEYYFKGEGSVKYIADNTHGSHTIKAVSALPLGKVSPMKRLFRRKLVSIGVNSSSTKTYTTADAAVSGFMVDKAGVNEAVVMTLKTPEEGEDVAVLDPATDPVGTYVFVQDSTGVYIDYVGYCGPFSIWLR